MTYAETDLVTRITTSTTSTTVTTTKTVEETRPGNDLTHEALRTILGLIPNGAGYGAWWGSPAGITFHDIVKCGFGRRLSAYFSRTYGQAIDPEEVANTTVEILADAATLLRITQAAEPCAYLYTVLRNELTRRAGQFFRAELEGNAAAELQHNDPKTFAMDDRQHMLTPVCLAEQLTVSHLRPHTPPAVLPHLAHLVEYFVEHAQAHLDAVITQAAADPDLLNRNLAPSEIRAVGNVVLGSRPNHGTNSLLGEIIRDQNFDPAKSTDHSAAIAKYQRRIRGIARK